MTNDSTRDVTDATFAKEVVEESKRRPVVVDLWASWCAPCRVLGPVLEKLAEEKGGAFLLARVDVDANPVVAGELGVMSIPAVKMFVDGELVDGFTGTLPEEVVREWLEAILPTPADGFAGEAEAAEGRGDLAGAEAGYRRALQSDPENRAARLGLGRLLSGRGEHEEARELASALLPDPKAERIIAGIRVQEWGSLEEAGALPSAKRLAAQGSWRDALERMLGLVQDDPRAREAMLDVLAVLGDGDELTREYRPRLASALF